MSRTAPFAAPVSLLALGGEAQSGAPGRSSRAEAVGLLAVGAALGISQVVHGAYDESVWAPIALGALALMLGLMLGAPRRVPLAVLVPLLGLWSWSLVSSAWSESTDSAHLASNRWLLYAAAFGLLAWSIAGNRRRALTLLAGTAAGILGVALWMLVRMLSGHGPELFLTTRLNDPLGYVNGEAGYLLAGIWPCLALAERPDWRSPAAAGSGLAAVVILAGLGVLTQSRSFGLGLCVALALLLGLIPGRLTRAGACLLIAGALALSYSSLAAVWRHPAASGAPTTASTRHAALVLLAAALLAGALWSSIAVAARRWGPAGSVRRNQAIRLANGGLAALALAAVLGVAINAGAIERRIHTQYDAFVHLAPSPTSSRLFSGGGNRFDYWRVAWIEFRSAPLGGVGAGNYPPDYYVHRRTTEAIQQPHSLELQTLAELGLVGLALLAGLLVAVARGFARTARAARGDPLARATAIAAGGAFTGWLLQTSVDWLHLIPGLTAIALGAAAALVLGSTSRPRALVGSAHAAAVAVAATLACVGALTIAPRVLALHERTLAQRALAAGAPARAVLEASRAIGYDSSSVSALVLRAAGFARLHAFSSALGDLRHALAVEPRNWVTWALLGDLLTRHGELRGALAAYRRALSLNPREEGLQAALQSR